MAASTIAIGGNTDAEVRGQTFFFFAPLFLPLVILGVPIVDTAWALLRRAKGRAGLTIADKGHLHHRLMRLGHGQRRAVIILWAWTALLSGAVLCARVHGGQHRVDPARGGGPGAAALHPAGPGLARPPSRGDGRGLGVAGAGVPVAADPGTVPTAAAAAPSSPPPPTGRGRMSARLGAEVRLGLIPSRRSWRRGRGGVGPASAEPILRPAHGPKRRICRCEPNL